MRGDPAWIDETRCDDGEGNSQTTLVDRTRVVEVAVVLVQILAVIGDEHDHGAFHVEVLFDQLQQPTDPQVGSEDGRIVDRIEVLEGFERDLKAELQKTQRALETTEQQRAGYEQGLAQEEQAHAEARNKIAELTKCKTRAQSDARSHEVLSKTRCFRGS